VRGLLAACLLALGVAHAEIVPTPGSFDSRIRVVAYNPDDVIQLHGYEGYSIHIQFAEGEEMIGIGSGFNDAVNFVGEANHVFLKPLKRKFKTNLIVLTNRRPYQIEYTVNETPAKEPPSMIYSLRFTYPQDEAKAAAAKAEAAKLANRLAVPSNLPQNRDYWFCGDKTMQPEEAYDDGIQTHLRFPARAEFPAMFVRNEDGSESLLNFNIDAKTGDVVVHRVARQMVLRRGGVVGCIVNKSFDAGGTRLPSNTMTPGVERVTLEPAP
jgi:type IV secretion system protein VirB9